MMTTWSTVRRAEADGDPVSVAGSEEAVLDGVGVGVDGGGEGAGAGPVHPARSSPSARTAAGAGMPARLTSTHRR